MYTASGTLYTTVAVSLLDALVTLVTRVGAAAGSKALVLVRFLHAPRTCSL